MIALSFDSDQDLFTHMAMADPELYSSELYSSRDSLRSIVKDMEQAFHRWFASLPEVDYEIARMYYVEDHTQVQVARFIGITQSAICKRLQNMKERLRLLIRMPVTDPIRVRSDFQLIFDHDLFEFAYFYYFEPSQNRVRHFVDTSHSGAGNKFRQVVERLEELAQADDPMSQLARFYLGFFKESRRMATKMSQIGFFKETRRTETVQTCS